MVIYLYFSYLILLLIALISERRLDAVGNVREGKAWFGKDKIPLKERSGKNDGIRNQNGINPLEKRRKNAYLESKGREKKNWNLEAIEGAGREEATGGGVKKAKDGVRNHWLEKEGRGSIQERIREGRETETHRNAEEERSTHQGRRKKEKIRRIFFNDREDGIRVVESNGAKKDRIKKAR